MVRSVPIGTARIPRLLAHVDALVDAEHAAPAGPVVLPDDA